MNIGIDLGTTNTVAGWMNLFGNIEFLEFDDGCITLPSCVYYDHGKIITGRQAVRMSAENPSCFISGSKTWMDDKKKTWEIEGKRFKAEDIAFEILKKVKKTLAERFPEEKTFNAVITVPAKFGEDQIKRTVTAMKRAGIGLIEVLKEPVAAVLAYNDDMFHADETVYLIDFGGGTIDAALIKLCGNDSITDFSVLAANGNRHLGGRDLDKVISSFVFDQFNSCSGQDLRDENTTWGSARKKIRQSILNMSEKAKINLFSKNISSSEDILVSDEKICSVCEKKADCSYDRCFCTEISYDDYLEAADEIYQQITDLIISDNVMEHHIDHVIFAGGMSADPYLRQFISDTFSDSNVIFASDVQDEKRYLTVIARGAAIKACDESIHVVNKLLNSLGIICSERGGKKYFDPVIESGTDIEPGFESVHVYTNNGRFETELTFELYEYNGDPNDLFDTEYRKIGSFTFNDIQPMDTGKQKIETIFSFDERGVLSVVARDLNDQRRSIDVSFEI